MQKEIIFEKFKFQFEKDQDGEKKKNKKKLKKANEKKIWQYLKEHEEIKII
jgi:hypothetical protein